MCVAITELALFQEPSTKQRKLYMYMVFRSIILTELRSNLRNQRVFLKKTSTPLNRPPLFECEGPIAGFTRHALKPCLRSGQLVCYGHAESVWLEKSSPRESRNNVNLIKLIRYQFFKIRLIHIWLLYIGRRTLLFLYIYKRCTDCGHFFQGKEMLSIDNPAVCTIIPTRRMWSVRYWG
jgi:hypothetical protein